MATSLIHDDIKKLVGLLVNSVHLVKSPANRKKFFIVKGEQNKMNEEELKKKLKEEELSDDEIAYILSNDNIKSILMESENEKKALEVLKDGIKGSLKDIENVLEAKSINDLTSEIIEPFEKLTNFLSTGNGKNDDDKNKKDDKDKDDNLDKEIDNSVSELVNEISGLSEDVVELADTLTDE